MMAGAAGGLAGGQAAAAEAAGGGDDEAVTPRVVVYLRLPPDYYLNADPAAHGAAVGPVPTEPAVPPQQLPPPPPVRAADVEEHVRWRGARAVRLTLALTLALTLQAGHTLEWDGKVVEVRVPPSKIVLGHPVRASPDPEPPGPGLHHNPNLHPNPNPTSDPDPNPEPEPKPGPNPNHLTLTRPPRRPHRRRGPSPGRTARPSWSRSIGTLPSCRRPRA